MREVVLRLRSSIVLRQGQTSHAHSEAEAILEQRLLFVSLCEARKAFTRL